MAYLARFFFSWLTCFSYSSTAI